MYSIGVLSNEEKLARRKEENFRVGSVLNEEGMLPLACQRSRVDLKEASQSHKREEANNKRGYIPYREHGGVNVDRKVETREVGFLRLLHRIEIVTADEMKLHFVFWLPHLQRIGTRIELAKVEVSRRE